MRLKEYVPALGAVLLGALVLAIAMFSFRNLAADRAEQELQARLRTMLPGSAPFTRKEGEGELVRAL